MQRPKSPIVIYLLHSQAPDGALAHYVGSTRLDQLRRRLRAHAHGYGSHTTRQYYAAQHETHLARTWPAPTRRLETALQHVKALHSLCPICRPSLRIGHEKRLTRLHADQPPESAFDGLSY